MEIFGIDASQAILVVLSLILIEALLSVDNAAVLANMVMVLPKEQRAKALKYGIVGAYVFRGLCLFLAEYLIKIWWLKPIGGLYLLYLAFKFFFLTKKHDHSSEIDEAEGAKKSKLYKLTIGKIGLFWGTVISIEVMDLAFSMDNVLAAVAYTERMPHPGGLYLLWIGVFIGILAMRFVAQGFVKLMEKFPFLETSAFIIIAILGIKLVSSGICHFWENTLFCKIVNGERADIYLSLITVAIFVIPILISLIWKKRAKKEVSSTIKPDN